MQYPIGNKFSATIHELISKFTIAQYGPSLFTSTCYIFNMMYRPCVNVRVSMSTLHMLHVLDPVEYIYYFVLM